MQKIRRKYTSIANTKKLNIFNLRKKYLKPMETINKSPKKFALLKLV